MFEPCPLSKNNGKICEFAIIRDGINYCGLANSECDPVGESRISDLKFCPRDKIKRKKRRKR